jgi:hypothetical protein
MRRVAPEGPVDVGVWVVRTGSGVPHGHLGGRDQVLTADDRKRSITPTVETPLVLVVVDEWPSVHADAAVAEHAAEIVRQHRKHAIRLCLSGQDFRVEMLPGGARAQYGTRLCLREMSAEGARAVLGSGFDPKTHRTAALPDPAKRGQARGYLATDGDIVEIRTRALPPMLISQLRRGVAPTEVPMRHSGAGPDHPNAHVNGALGRDSSHRLIPSVPDAVRDISPAAVAVWDAIAHGAPESGRALSTASGVSRAHVARLVARLREEGLLPSDAHAETPAGRDVAD